MLHSQFVPHIVATVPQNWLGLGHEPLCRSHGWTVVNHYCTQNWGLTIFLGNAALTMFVPQLWSLCPKTGWSWPCSLCAESHGWTIIAHKTGVSHVCDHHCLAPHCGNNDLPQSNHDFIITQKLAAMAKTELTVWGPHCGHNVGHKQ